MPLLVGYTTETPHLHEFNLRGVERILLVESDDLSVNLGFTFLKLSLLGCSGRLALLVLGNAILLSRLWKLLLDDFLLNLCGW